MKKKPGRVSIQRFLVVKGNSLRCESNVGKMEAERKSEACKVYNTSLHRPKCSRTHITTFFYISSRSCSTRLVRVEWSV